MSLDFTQLDQAVDGFERALSGLFEGLPIDDKLHRHAKRIADGTRELLLAAKELQAAIDASGLKMPEGPEWLSSPPPLVVYPPDTLPVLVKETLRFAKSWLPNLRARKFWQPGVYDFDYEFPRSLEQLRTNVFNAWPAVRADYEHRKALALDAAALHDQPEPELEPAPEPSNQATNRPARKSKPRITQEEANLRAREALKGRPPKGQKRWTVRSLAKAIGCSGSLVPELPAWQAYREDHYRRRGTAGRPRAVTLSESHLAITGQPDPELQALIDEQVADYEPSPLESRGRSPRIRRTL